MTTENLVSELRGPDERGYITASRAFAANEIEELRALLAEAAEELLDCDASGRPTGSCGDLGMRIKERISR